MTVKIGSARIDENGKTHGGKAGGDSGAERGFTGSALPGCDHKYLSHGYTSLMVAHIYYISNSANFNRIIWTDGRKCVRIVKGGW